jgi:hypothetical protein
MVCQGPARPWPGIDYNQTPDPTAATATSRVTSCLLRLVRARCDRRGGRRGVHRWAGRLAVWRTAVWHRRPGHRHHRRSPKGSEAKPRPPKSPGDALPKEDRCPPLTSPPTASSSGPGPTPTPSPPSRWRPASVAPCGCRSWVRPPGCCGPPSPPSSACGRWCAGPRTASCTRSGSGAPANWNAPWSAWPASSSPPPTRTCG